MKFRVYLPPPSPAPLILNLLSTGAVLLFNRPYFELDKDYLDMESMGKIKEEERVRGIFLTWIFLYPEVMAVLKVKILLGPSGNI